MTAWPSATSSSPPFPLSFHHLLLPLTLLPLILVLVFVILLLFLPNILPSFLFSFLFFIGLFYSDIFIVKRSARLRWVNIALKRSRDKSNTTSVVNYSMTARTVNINVSSQPRHDCTDYINPLFPGRQIYVVCRCSVLTLGYGRVRFLDWRREGSDAGHRRVPAGGSGKCHCVCLHNTSKTLALTRQI